MPYTMFRVNDWDTEDLTPVDALLLDGMLVADRALEDVFFVITTDGNGTVQAHLQDASLVDPLMDQTRLCAKAVEAALGADMLSTADGADGILWNHDLSPEDQYCVFTRIPEALR